MRKIISKYLQPDHHFAIASHLLGDSRPLAWTNLGFWQGTHDYPVACQQLAQLVGKAARLAPSDHLLDLGGGQGASLVYWNTAFAIEHMSAFELQPACINAINKARLPQLDGIYQASFSQLPLPAVHLQQAFDAVVCVDAAYHALLADFLAVNKAALKNQGRIAFTTLMLSPLWIKASVMQKKLTLKLLGLACVPQQHLLNEMQVVTQLQASGFTHIKIKHLDQPVLQGFAHYIAHHHPPVRAGQYRDWLKIRCTAKLCGFLYRQGLVHYSLISAELA
ncbi:SAM-dependent methyltransferase [Alkanindiges sp. WGS2144]|uniref:SAM-dependent methyltransferase n=1 Tax=Alkanindiges sp. WGS2144 TaxID=3366808 RepID=UPI003752F93B